MQGRNQDTLVPSGLQAGMRLCEAFGFDPDMVQELTIHVSAGNLPTVSVRGFVRDRETQQLERWAQAYELTPKPQHVQ